MLFSVFSSSSTYAVYSLAASSSRPLHFCFTPFFASLRPTASAAPIPPPLTRQAANTFNNTYFPYTVTGPAPPPLYTSGSILDSCTAPNSYAISFDDGPGQLTDELLDYLDEQQLKVTFFMNGDNWDCIYRKFIKSSHTITYHRIFVVHLICKACTSATTKDSRLLKNKRDQSSNGRLSFPPRVHSFLTSLFFLISISLPSFFPFPFPLFLIFSQLWYLGRFSLPTSGPESQRLLKRAYQAQHQIAAHPWSHHDLDSLSDHDIRDEMYKIENAFRQILGVVPRYMRPPYGEASERVRKVLRGLGYVLILWDVDQLNKKNPTGGETQKPMMSGHQQASFSSKWAEAVRGVPHSALDRESMMVGGIYQEATSVWAVEYVQNLGYDVMPVGQCLGEADPRLWYKEIGMPETEEDLPQSCYF